MTAKETFIHPSNVNTKSKKKQGQNMFEINVRAIIAFREICRGLEANHFLDA